MSPWPLHAVTLVNADGDIIDQWTGYLVPAYLGGLPNVNSAWPYRLEYECGLIWKLPCGDLEQCAWEAVMVHESWCKGCPPGLASGPAGSRHGRASSGVRMRSNVFECVKLRVANCPLGRDWSPS